MSELSVLKQGLVPLEKSVTALLLSWSDLSELEKFVKLVLELSVF